MMDSRVDLTLNQDFSRVRINTRIPNKKYNSPTGSEELCGFATGSLDEIKYKNRILKMYYSVEGFKPKCHRCGKDIVFKESTLCNPCSTELEGEIFEGELSFYFVNRIKNRDSETDLVKQLF